MRLPNHIGIIPDGNRRWAESKGLSKVEGWDHGLIPGIELFRLIQQAGVSEVTYYGFTMENARRPAIQRDAIIDCCIQAVDMLSKEDAELLVVGKSDTTVFPEVLLPYTTERKTFNKGGIKTNFLVNYGWEWDLNQLRKADPKKPGVISNLRSSGISKIDLIIRWGGWSRLSGFLPAQSIYSDIYIIDEYWPDFKPEHLTKALEWYAKQSVTLGG
jgi:undecaprenyl diphosphate synthase